MTTSRRALGMGGSIVAATAALVLVGTTAASAHHCYKDEWQAAAYQRHLAGGTAWVPLSDLASTFIEPEDQELCGYIGDEVVADFMLAYGLTQEPILHSRAIVGGGALHHKGKEPAPFSYLVEEHFVWLTGELTSRLTECKGV